MVTCTERDPYPKLQQHACYSGPNREYVEPKRKPWHQFRCLLFLSRASDGSESWQLSLELHSRREQDFIGRRALLQGYWASNERSWKRGSRRAGVSAMMLCVRGIISHFEPYDDILGPSRCTRLSASSEDGFPGWSVSLRYG